MKYPSLMLTILLSSNMMANNLVTSSHETASTPSSAYSSIDGARVAEISNNQTSALTGVSGITTIYCSATGKLTDLYKQANYPTKVKISGRVTMQDLYKAFNASGNRGRITYLDLSDATMEQGPAFSFEMMYLEQCDVTGEEGTFDTGILIESGGQDADDYSYLETLVLPTNLKKLICHHQAASSYKRFSLTDVYSKSMTPTDGIESYAIKHTYLHVPQGTKAAWDAVASSKTIVTTTAEKNIACSVPSNLASMLSSSDMQNLDRLTITGKIDARDFLTLSQMKQLTELTINASIEYYNGTGGPASSSSIYKAGEIPENTFMDNKTLKYVDINASDVANKAFLRCTCLVSMNLTSSSSHAIKDYAFDGCTNLAFFECSKVNGGNFVGGARWIGDYAFRNTQVGSITLAKEVTIIGKNPFWGTEDSDWRRYRNSVLIWPNDDKATEYEVKGISIDNTEGCQLIYSEDHKELKASYVYKNASSHSLKIDDATQTIVPYALSDLPTLTELTLGKNVSVGEGFAAACPNLATIHIPEESTYLTLTDGVLYSKDHHTLIKYPAALPGDDYTIMDGVTGIQPYAFDCAKNLTSLTIPNTVTSVGAHAFDDCKSLTDIYIFAKKAPQGYNFGVNCNLHILPGTRKSYESFEEWSKFNIIEEEAYVIDDGTLKYLILSPTEHIVSCEGFVDSHINDTNLLIPETVEKDGITYQVTEVDESAFKDCTGITTLYVPASVTSIGNYAFNGCTALSEITLADGKEPLSIGYNTYTQESYGRGMFRDCPLKKLYLGRNLTYESYGSFDSQWGFSPFANTPLADVTIGSCVTSVYRQCFRNTQVAHIEIPSSVTYIADMAFMLCGQLTDVTMSANTEAIGGWAFHGCAFSEFNIPQKVTRIGANAFTACANLKSICIPATVQMMGNGGRGFYSGAVFAGCRSLTNLYIEDSDNPLEYCNHMDGDQSREYESVEKLHIGRNITLSQGNTNQASIFQHSFFRNVQEVSISDKVTSLPDYLFEGCNKLTVIEIPISVTEIGKKAFYGCTQLASIVCKTASAPSTNVLCETDRYPQILLLASKTSTGYDKGEWALFKKPNEVNLTDNNASVEENNIYPEGYFTYTRENLRPDSYATFCLPFSTNLSNLDDAFDAIYTTNGTALLKNDGKLILMLKKVEPTSTIPAGQPFIGKVNTTISSVTFANCDLLEVGENTMVNPAPKHLEVYNWNGISGLLTENTDLSVSFGGSLTTMSDKGPEYETFNANGSFGPTANGMVKAFRAYVVKENAAANSQIKSISIGMDEESTGISIVAPTVSPSTEEAFGLDGRRIKYNGDKGKLPQGIYIINNKKVIIK